MKTAYAFIAVCLALQACNIPSDAQTVSTNINEYSTILEYVGIVPLYDEYDYTAAIGTTPAIKPIDGAEFDGTSRDDANSPWMASMESHDENDGGTAPASQSASTSMWDFSMEDYHFWVNDEPFDLQVTNTIDLHTIQAKDWW
jgi:hypothetical protein